MCSQCLRGLADEVQRRGEGVTTNMSGNVPVLAAILVGLVKAAMDISGDRGGLRAVSDDGDIRSNLREHILRSEQETEPRDALARRA